MRDCLLIASLAALRRIIRRPSPFRSSSLETSDSYQSISQREPQRLKPSLPKPRTASLKRCPDTNHFSNRTLFKSNRFSKLHLCGYCCALFQECEQICVDLILVGGAHAVRESWIDLQNRAFNNLR